MTVKKKRALATPQPPAFREVETNARVATAYANRVATYASALDVRIRFLQESAYPRGTALHGDVPTIEITNIADVALSPVVAKRLVADLEQALKQHEFMTNTVIPDLDAMTQAAHNRLNPTPKERVN